jgi:F-type H+/Na+-transporting ATPase subunit alpha
VNNGFADSYAETDIRRYEKEMLEFIKTKHSHISKNIAEKKTIADDTKKQLTDALTEFKAVFQPTKDKK